MNIVLTGGGTMGHINPAIAIYREIKTRLPNVRFYYFGCPNSLEEKAINEFKDIRFYKIAIRGLSRKNFFKNFSLISVFLKEKKRVRAIFDEIKPDIVIGTGGYVSAIPLSISKKNKIPYVLHEQNSVPGLTNYWFGKKANAVFISFSECAKYFKKDVCLLYGNPSSDLIRKRYVSSKINYPFGYQKVLVVGGSLGSKKLNEIFLETIDYFKNEKVFFVFITGKKYYPEYEMVNKKNLCLFPFIEDLPNVMAEVDLIISRAGATTISEILAVKKPAILIPSPNVTANHQEKNANYLSKNDACIKIEEHILSPKVLYLEIQELLRNSIWKMRMIENQHRLYISHSSEKIVMKLREILGG